jgi:hypothetical protein
MAAVFLQNGNPLMPKKHKFHNTQPGVRQSEINNCGIFIHVKVRACIFISYVDGVPRGAQDFKRIFFKASVLQFMIQLPLHFRNSQEFKYINILFMLPEFTFPLILCVFSVMPQCPTEH